MFAGWALKELVWIGQAFWLDAQASPTPVFGALKDDERYVLEPNFVQMFYSHVTPLNGVTMTTHTDADTPRTKGHGRKDTVKPPPDLPDGSPMERMTELMRRLIAVPKAETIPPKKRPKRKRA